MTASSLSNSQRETALAGISEWIVKRGILALFLLMPAAVVLVGFLLRLIPLPVATYGVFVSFFGFTAWVSYRTSASDDPNEPVHHLHRYALYALLPIAIFSLVQMLAFFAADVVYWQLWHELGAALTREPSTELWSLVAGVVVYVLLGMGLVMSYYALVPRPNLFNAAIFLGLVVPALFVLLFSELSVTGRNWVRPGM